MLRILLFCSATSAACTPSPQDAAMRRSSQTPEVIQQAAGEARPEGRVPAVPGSAGQAVDDRAHAAQGPVPASVSASENPVPIPAQTPAQMPAQTPAQTMPIDSPAEAVGRRTLSTAFVRVGPDGHLTVELRSGHMLVLRNVVMRATDYCGVQVAGGPGGTKYCGGYADIAAARPGGPVTPVEPGPAETNPVEPERGASRHK